MTTENFKKTLLEKKAKLENRLGALAKEKRRDTPISADFEEQAVELENNDVIDEIQNVELKELELVNRALSRIEEGKFGLCHECGDEISAERLKALPFALNCIDCQQAQ